MPSTTKIFHLLSTSEQHVPPTVVVRPWYAWGVEKQWGGLASQKNTQMQLHIVNMMIQEKQEKMSSCCLYEGPFSVLGGTEVHA